MNKNLLLSIVSGLITLLVALVIIEQFAPQLLGRSRDLEIVQIDDKVSPFFEVLFNNPLMQDRQLLLPDPLTKHRAYPLMPETSIRGNHDLIGFRNLHIPNRADILVFGDSQTYGTNVPLFENWPQQMRRGLGLSNATSVYNLGVGGWTGIQYGYMFSRAVPYLRPQATVIAFYTGNDPLEAFMLAYGAEAWAQYRLNPDLSSSDAPGFNYPPTAGELWDAKIADDLTMTFSPSVRLPSNARSGAADVGYQILLQIAREIHQLGTQYSIDVFFTVIPTKELVYRYQVNAHTAQVREDYKQLVEAEAGRIAWFEEQLRLEGANYVDLLGPLQASAGRGELLYPLDKDGHPRRAGYAVIADTVGAELEPVLAAPITGLSALRDQAGVVSHVLLVAGSSYWTLPGPRIIEGNGWTLGDVNQLPDLPAFYLNKLTYRGDLNEIAPEKYSPERIEEYLLTLGSE